MAAKLDWFPFDTARWLGDEQVGIMSLAARGAYVDALVVQWREGSIPDDLRRLARLIRADYADLKRVWNEIQDRFEQVPGLEGRLFNRTLKEIREKQAVRSEVNRENANKRWHGDEPTETEEPTPGPEEPAAQPVGIPDELAGLTLYAADAKLCKRWAELKTAWQQACPGIDVLAEVRKAHAWEVANPKKVKKDRARFLGSWMNRAQDRGGPSGGGRQQGNRLFAAAGQDAKEYENL